MNRERGSATVVGLLLAAIFGFGLISVGSLAALYSARVHAGTAADAAALAAAPATYPPTGGLLTPDEEARRYAALNGAVVKRCVCQVDRTLRPRRVTVIVEIKVKLPIFGVMGVKAGATSEFDPVLWLGR